MSPYEIDASHCITARGGLGVIEDRPEYRLTFDYSPEIRSHAVCIRAGVELIVEMRPPSKVVTQIVMRPGELHRFPLGYFEHTCNIDIRFIEERELVGVIPKSLTPLEEYCK